MDINDLSVNMEMYYDKKLNFVMILCEHLSLPKVFNQKFKKIQTENWLLLTEYSLNQHVLLIANSLYLDTTLRIRGTDAPYFTINYNTICY